MGDRSHVMSGSDTCQPWILGTMLRVACESCWAASGCMQYSCDVAETASFSYNTLAIGPSTICTSRTANGCFGEISLRQDCHISNAREAPEAFAAATSVQDRGINPSACPCQHSSTACSKIF